MKIPVSSLEASVLDDVYKNTKILKRERLEYFIYIHLPSVLTRTAQLYQMNEMIPEPCEVTFFKLIEHTFGRPWIKIPTQLLNREIGRHEYQLQFVETTTNEPFSLYFSYEIQSDDPATPYIYMNRTGC